MIEASRRLDVDHELIKKGVSILEEERHVIREDSYIWIAPLYASERGLRMS